MPAWRLRLQRGGYTRDQAVRRSPTVTTRAFDRLPNEVAQVLHDLLAWRVLTMEGRPIQARLALKELDVSAEVLRTWLQDQRTTFRLPSDVPPPPREPGPPVLHLVKPAAKPPETEGD